MARTADGVSIDLGERLVSASPLRRGMALVERRREQWVRKGDRFVRGFDDVGHNARLEHVVRHANARQQLLRWMPERRHKQQRRARCLRKTVEAADEKFFERLWNG